MLVWLAIIGYLIFNVLYFLALRRTTATHVVLVWGAQPVLTAVLAALLIGEREALSWIHALGALLIVGGVLIANLRAAPRRRMASRTAPAD
jgi:drug/metabolite transporter (DMT)-like permease